MKYTIAYTEIIPRLQELEADNENAAIHNLFSLMLRK